MTGTGKVLAAAIVSGIAVIVLKPHMASMPPAATVSAIAAQTVRPDETPIGAARSIYAGFELNAARHPDERGYISFGDTNCKNPKDKTTCTHDSKALVLKYQDKSLSVRTARDRFLEHTRDVVPFIFKNFPEADSVLIAAFTDFVDVRGNDTNHELFTIRIDRRNSDATNWNNVSLNNIMTFAEAYWQHQLATKELGDPNAERTERAINEAFDCSSGLCYPR
jgi:hypothetical protein